MCGLGLSKLSSTRSTLISLKTWPKKSGVDTSQPLAALLLLFLQSFVPNYWCQQLHPAWGSMPRQVKHLCANAYWKVASHPCTQLRDRGKQHCRTLELIPSYREGASWCLWQGRRASVTGWAETTEENKMKECGREKKAGEKLHVVTSPGNTDERNNRELSRVISTGQSTSPVHDSHQPYSKTQLHNRAVWAWVNFLCQLVIMI